MNKGVFHSMLQPEEVATAIRVFQSVVEEPWFDRTHDNDLDCAKIVVRAYQQGMINEEKLKRYVRVIAAQRFAKLQDTPVILH